MALLMMTLLTLLRHPFVQAVQVQASFILLVGIIGWTVAGFRRGQEAQRLSAAGYATALQQIQALKQAATADSLSHCSSLESSSSPGDGKVEVQLCNAAVRGEAHLASDADESVHTCKSACAVDEYFKEPSGGLSRAQQLEQNSNSELRFRGQMSAQQQLPGSRGVQLRTGDADVAQNAGQTAVAAAAVPGGSSIFKSRLGQTAGLASGWPAVAVVCPVKGCRQHSRDNWTTQLTAHYGGPRVFIFVVESSHDPAVAALRDVIRQQQPWQLQQHCKQQQQQLQQQSWPCQAAAATVKGQQQQQQQPTVASGAVLPEISHSGLRGDAEQQNPLPELHHHQRQQWHQQRHQQQQQQQQQCVLDMWCAGTDQQVLLVNAGLATTCSQKIHNILAGIEVALPALQQQQGSKTLGNVTTAAAAVSAEYVCIMDDDVCVHPLSIMQLVDELEHDQSLFMATGFPYDIVTDSSSSSSSSSFWSRLCAHASAAYHLPLCIAFSVADRGGFVWGGAMVMRAEHLCTPATQLPAAGTTSTPPPSPAAAAAGGASQMSARPVLPQTAAAVARNQLPVGRSNILQVWRDGGYSDDLLLSGFCAAAKLSIAVPVSAYFPQLLPATCTFKQYWNYLRRQLFVLDTYYSSDNKRLNHIMMAAHSYGSALFTGATAATLLQLALLLLLTAYMLLAGFASGGSSSNSWNGSSGSFSPLSLTTSAMWVFISCTILSLLAISYLTQQVRRLFSVLSPHGLAEVQQCRVSVTMLWLGWMLENLILPYCTLNCYLCDHIVWGGITYHKKKGRVDRIMHPKQVS